MTELKITKERILEAASKCSTAKETLKTLFPEVFQQSVDFSDLPNISLLGSEYPKIEPRFFGEFAGKGLWLDDCYDWEIKTDKKNQRILIPTKK
jgi:hypothetical protein